jgi:anti-sigma regulatory factor (Ser/Thr protein kinase)
VSDAYSLTLRNDRAELARMMTWIDDIVAALELSADTTYALQLCLEEAVVNVISYGFEPDSEHDVRIAVWRDDGLVRAEITDDGMPFDPLAQALPETPSDLESAQIGGLGIKLMRNFATNIAYQRAGSSNRLTLTFAA